MLTISKRRLSDTVSYTVLISGCITAISRPLGAMPDLEPWPFKVACRYERSFKERLADRLMLCYLLEAGISSAHQSLPGHTYDQTEDSSCRVKALRIPSKVPRFQDLLTAQRSQLFRSRIEAAVLFGDGRGVASQTIIAIDIAFMSARLVCQTGCVADFQVSRIVPRCTRSKEVDGPAVVRLAG